MRENFHKRLAAVKTADAINAIKGVPVSADAKLLSGKWVRGELTGGRIGAIIEFKRLWGMKSVTAADLWGKQD